MLAKSARMYFAAFGKWFWVFIGTEAASVVGLAEAFAFTTGVPRWIWWTFILTGFALAPFVAFHRYRLYSEAEFAKRDVAVLAANRRADAAIATFGRIAALLDEGTNLRCRTIYGNEVTLWESECVAWYERTRGFLQITLHDKVVFFDGIPQTTDNRSEIYHYCEKLKEILLQATNSA